MAWVYILRGANGRFYIGYTTDLPRRLDEHLRGSCHTTRRLRNEIEVVISVKLTDARKASELERYLKAFKNGAKAVEYLRRNFEALSSPD